MSDHGGNKPMTWGMLAQSSAIFHMTPKVVGSIPVVVQCSHN